MAIKFNKHLVNIARDECSRVYVDLETPEKYISSLRGYIGDRLRIYVTGWNYEIPVIIKSNAELKIWLKNHLSETYYGIEYAMPII